MPAYDVIIVGARCAGAPLAMLLARQGRRVIALDRAMFPSDTISTHFLWPRSTAFLAAWGLLGKLSDTGCPLIESVTMDCGPVAVRGRPDAVDGTAAMFCPRRTVLDMLLVQAARDAGAEVRERTVVRDLLHDVTGRVVGVRATGPQGGTHELRASFVVGADGAFSRVAAAVGAAATRSHPSLTCGFYAYWSGVPADGVAFHIRHGRDVLVFPTHDDLTCIWVGRANHQWADYRADVEAAYLAGLDADLGTRVRAGRRVTPFKGTSKLPNFYRQAWGDGWALVGDAAYHRDPLTGMGIGDAFLGAHLLASALGQALDDDGPDTLSGYQQQIRLRTEAVFDYTLKSASLQDPAPLVPFYTAISGRPDATRHLMNVLAGTVPFRSLFNAEMIGRIMSDAATATGQPEAPRPTA